MKNREDEDLRILGLHAEGEGSQEQDPRLTGTKGFIVYPPDEVAPHYQITGDDIVQKMGISGASIVVHSNREFVSLITVFCQAVVLQYIILWQLYAEVKKASSPATPNHLGFSTWLMLMAALHLHFINCFGDIPFSVTVLMNIHHFHDTAKELLIAAPIFAIDAVMTPMLQLIIGALFICSSTSEVDILMNSCAVAFISNIDNWILTLSDQIAEMAGDLSECTVNMPYRKALPKFMEFAVCLVPILPYLFGAIIIYVSTEILGMGIQAE